jgi:hypothetical protein
VPSRPTPTRPATRPGFRVQIYQGDLDDIADRVAGYPHAETGGNLFGFWTHTGNPAVQLVLGPGPRSRHESAAFFQDVDHLRTHGASLRDAYGLQHVGDWHSHHRFDLSEPSGGDAASVHRTLSSTGFARFLLCVANIRPAAPRTGGGPRRPTNGGASRDRRRPGADLLVTVSAYLFRAGHPPFERGRFVVLPGESPIVAAARRDSILGTPARRGTAWYVEEVGHAEVRTIAAGWHTGDWGGSFLRRLDELLRGAFGDCRLLLAPGGELSYEFVAGGVRGRLVFPPAFPQARAELCVGRGRWTVETGGDTADDFHDAVRALLDGYAVAGPGR